MKKLLAALAAFGLTASAATSVVACDNGNSESDKLTKDVYKDFKRPETKEANEKAQEAIYKQASDLAKEIAKEVGMKDNEVPTQKQIDEFLKHTKANSLFAVQVLSQVLWVNENILDKDEEQAKSALEGLESFKEGNTFTPDGTELKVVIKASKINSDKIDEFVKELTPLVKALGEETEEPTDPGTEEPGTEEPGQGTDDQN